MPRSFSPCPAYQRSINDSHRLHLRGWFIILVLISLIVSLTSTSFSQTPDPASLVKDIAPGDGASSPQVEQLTPVGDGIFFSMDDGVAGSEPWYSDGTTAGSYRIQDLSAGLETSTPKNFTDGQESLFFTAYSTYNFEQLWKSDGTAAGTIPLTNFSHYAFITNQDDYPSEFVLGLTQLRLAQRLDGTNSAG